MMHNLTVMTVMCDMFALTELSQSQSVLQGNLFLCNKNYKKDFVKIKLKRN